jgi:DNA-binding NarL/FixJ family response regulator
MQNHASRSARTTDTPPHRVLLVEDHPIYRLGLSELLWSEPDFSLCAEVASAAEALSAIRRTDVDVALVDLSLGGANGIELTKQIRSERPKLPILIISWHDEQLYAMRALRAGANGYVMKGEKPEVILDALKKVAAGNMYVSPAVSESVVTRMVPHRRPEICPIDQLSDREIEVLQLLGSGKSTQEIAAMLHLSQKTVETHRLNVKQKMGLKTSAELTRFAVDWVGKQTNVRALLSLLRRMGCTKRKMTSPRSKIYAS